MNEKPLAFVIMPFGEKYDYEKRVKVNFDSIYDEIIIPALEKAGVDYIRANEEAHGGIIHLSIYERLLLAEIVVADLTLANPNVFYELGVRHAAKPRTTILIFGNITKLPFDVNLLRAIKYNLKNGKVEEESRENLKTVLVERLKLASEEEYEDIDSPIFQLIPRIKTLEVELGGTVSFRDRFRAITDTVKNIRSLVLSVSKESAIENIREIEGSMEPLKQKDADVLICMLEAYRDLSSWEDIIRLVDKFPSFLKSFTTVREQLAMAFRKRNYPGDREYALDILKSLIKEKGHSPENCGLLGSVFKGDYREASVSGKEDIANAALEEAINYYEKGFEADPRDFYPGINALTLLLIQDNSEALKRIERLKPVVAFAVGRLGGLKSEDYWVVATALELYALGQEWISAKRAVGRILLFNVPRWQYKTTLDNLFLIRNYIHKKGYDTTALDEIINSLTVKITE